MKDFLGKEISVGDSIVYAGRRPTRLEYGTVEAIREGVRRPPPADGRSWGGSYVWTVRPQLKVRIADKIFHHEPNGKSWFEDSTKVVSLTRVDCVAVVEPK